MSLRAYKLIEIKTADEPIFNYSQDYDFIEELRIGEGEEFLTFSVKRVKAKMKDKKTTAEQKEICKRIIQDAGEEYYIDYYLC